VTPRALLARGEITLKGRMPCSSNATFLAEVALEGATSLAVYKPARGERPLWDFPRGLFRREIAAYHLSEALGWGLVPLTLERDGPYGEGSVQAFVDADFEQHYFTLAENPEHRPQLEKICAFDIIANNADRKSGHCLLAQSAIYAIDNGLCFHAEPKLRTVIWDFAGTPVPRAVLDDVRRLLDTGVPKTVTALLAAEERTALTARAGALLAEGHFPVDDTGTRYPWPLV
jgi:uncharacterized repeat protein (TIGR03843 family)